MKRRPRRARLIALVLVALAAAGVLWLLRDPTPRYLARRSTLSLASESPAELDRGHFVQTVHLAATSGLTVDIAVKAPAELDPERPPGTRAQRRPVAIILGGHRTGRDAVNLIEDTHGVIIAAVSYPFAGNHRAKGLEVVKQVPLIRSAILDTPPAVMLALDYLLSRPDVDTTRIELLGVSLGAPFVAVAGALDERISRVWSVHGAGDLRTLLDHNLRKSIPAAPARVPVAGLAYLLASGPRIAPEKWVGRIAPRPFVMINATDDERLPRSAVLSLYEAAGQPKELVWMPGQHVQGKRTEIVRRLVEMVLARMRDSTQSVETS